MGIRGKTLLAISLVIAALLTAMGIGFFIASERTASQIEDRDVHDSLARAEAVIASEQTGLEAVVADWAQWTDTYRFVGGKMPEYAANNLSDPSYISNLNLDVVVFLNADGKIVASRQVDAKRQFIPLSAGIVSYLASRPSILQITNVKHNKSGLLRTPEGVYVIAARPITNDTASAPKAGTMLVGRFLGPRRIADMQKVLLEPLAVQDASSTTLSAADRAIAVRAGRDAVVVPRKADDSVMGYALRSDIENRPALLLSVKLPRIAEDFSAQSLFRSYAGMLGFAAIMIVAVGTAIDVNVLRRLNLLSSGVKGVGTSDNPASRIRMRGSDEISTVADSIDSMLNQLQESHSDLAYLASHDSLTRLYNRRRFEAELKSLLFREPGSGAVLWIDLDHFKDVNDSLGHAAGDQLLIHVANLLSKHLRDQSIVARLGGDEFGILLPGADAEQAIGAANRILNLFSQGLFAVATHDVRMSASVGVAVFPDDGTLVDDLLAHADLAMYQAKSKGRNALALFTSESEMQSGMTERILMAEQILRALRENRFQLYAQPLRRTSDASTNDYELLLRMVLEDGTIVMPDRIIPTAERIGLIRDIDRWVVRRGIEMIAEETALGRDTRFSVNVSGTAFSDPELLDIVRDEIDAHGIEPDRLIIEITETTAIADIEHAKAFIEELKDVGCRFALDDFGAGSSSFFYLKHLAVDFLKIDGGLVRNLCGDTTDKYFVRAIVEMCKGLGIPTVAEFVETDELYHLVRELGIDYAQGYGVGRPQPPGMYLAPFDDSSSLAVDTPASLNAEKVLDPDVT